MTVDVSIEFRGINQLAKNVQRAKSKIGKKLEKGVEAAAHVLQDASLPLSPFKTGLLRESSFVLPLVVDGFNTVFVVGFGSYSVHEANKIPASYAVIQHEDFEQKRTPGTQWKYLETPMRNNAVQLRMLEVIRDAIK